MKRAFDFLILVLVMMFAMESYSATMPIYQDVKLPTQKVIEMQSIANIGTTTTTSVLSSHAGNTSTAAATASTFLAQPDVPRNLVITPGGTTADVAACDVVVTGKNYFGNTITETLSFAANASTATTGSKAFKTVTSVAFPANCEDTPFGATWSIGLGAKIGLKRCMDYAGHLIQSTFNGDYESTRATMVVDNNEVEKNTADFDGAYNGANDFEIFFMQNYRCLN